MELEEFEERTGVKSNFGGSHPSNNTQHVIVSLGNEVYIEIRAPQDDVDSLNNLRETISILTVSEVFLILGLAYVVFHETEVEEKWRPERHWNLSSSGMIFVIPPKAADRYFYYCTATVI